MWRVMKKMLKIVKAEMLQSTRMNAAENVSDTWSVYGGSEARSQGGGEIYALLCSHVV